MPEAIRLPGYSANYVSYMSTALATRDVAGIAIPSSPIINAALEIVRTHLDESLYNHILRCWILGTAIADRTPNLTNRDREVHSIAVIFHDLGQDKSGNLVSKDKAHEVDCVNAVRAFLERHSIVSEWGQNRKQLLCDAVALHSSAHVAMNRQLEFVATFLGIIADFGGPNAVPGNVLTVAEWQRIAKEFPRSGLKNGIVQSSCGLCRTKPETTHNTVARISAENLVEGYCPNGHRWYDSVTNPVDAE